VSGTWTVARSATSLDGTARCTWVGIGGVSSQDLIQAGTEATNALGRVRFRAWIETLPQPAHAVPLVVMPGDSVTVSIVEQSAGSGAWQISISNNTTGQRYQSSVTYPSSESSAEWIMEAPTGATGILPLGHFGSVDFSVATTTTSGQNPNLIEAGARSVTMVNASNEPLAEPSSVGSDGASFTVTRTSAAATWTSAGREEPSEDSQLAAP
jgi:hypothetical protein